MTDACAAMAGAAKVMATARREEMLAGLIMRRISFVWSGEWFASLHRFLDKPQAPRLMLKPVLIGYYYGILQSKISVRRPQIRSSGTAEIRVDLGIYQDGRLCGADCGGDSHLSD